MPLDVVILAVGCRNAGKKGERMQGQPSPRCSDSSLLLFPSTARLQGDPQQNK